MFNLTNCSNKLLFVLILVFAFSLKSDSAFHLNMCYIKHVCFLDQPFNLSYI